MANATKFDLLNTLRESLKSKGWWTDYEDALSFRYEFGEEFLKSLEYGCTEEQIQYVLDSLNNDNHEKATDAYTAWKKAGYLKVKPCLVPGDVPSIILGIDKWLHWFRGYYFQISDTSDGVGEVYHGVDRLDHTLDYLEDLKYIDSYNQAARDVFTACLIPVLCHYDCGIDILRSNRELVNDFLEQSCGRSYVKSASLDDFDRLYSETVYESKPEIDDVLSDETYQAIQLICDGKCYGVLVLSSSEFVLIKSSSGSYKVAKFRLPDWFSLTDEEPAYYVERREFIAYIFVRALVCRNEWRFDHMCWYPFGTKKNAVDAIEYKTSKAVSSWEQLEPIIDGMFETYEN